MGGGGRGRGKGEYVVGGGKVDEGRGGVVGRGKRVGGGGTQRCEPPPGLAERLLEIVKSLVSFVQLNSKQPKHKITSQALQLKQQNKEEEKNPKHNCILNSTELSHRLHGGIKSTPKSMTRYLDLEGGGGGGGGGGREDQGGRG